MDPWLLKQHACVLNRPLLRKLRAAAAGADPGGARATAHADRDTGRGAGAAAAGGQAARLLRLPNAPDAGMRVSDGVPSTSSVTLPAFPGICQVSIMYSDHASIISADPVHACFQHACVLAKRDEVFSVVSQEGANWDHASMPRHK